MKKLFLFVSAVALSVSLNSCSSDSGGGSSVSMKVNGVNKNFKTEAVSFGGTTNVYGYTGNVDNPTEEISFALASGTGDKVSGLMYSNADGTYFDDTVVSDVTVNSASNAKGTFSGNVQNISETTTLAITEGKFNVKVIAE